MRELTPVRVRPADSLIDQTRIIRQERIAFNYGAGTYHVGHDLTDAETHELVRLIRNRVAAVDDEGMGDPAGFSDAPNFSGTLSVSDVIRVKRLPDPGDCLTIDSILIRDRRQTATH